MRRFFPRPVLLEMFLVFTAFFVFVTIIATSPTQVFLASGALFVYLLIPEFITFLPPRFHPPWVLAEEARRLPRKVKSWTEATKKCGPPTHELYAIVGGSGYIGSRILHALLLRGESKVRVIDMDVKAMNELQEIYGQKVEFVKADVTKSDEIYDALRGATCVYAPCSMIRYWEIYQKHWSRSLKVNVQGTQNVISACFAHNIKRLIVTSSSAAMEVWPSYFPEGVNDSTPVCTNRNYTSNYALSKALQETMALKHNGENGLAIGCIRPCSSVFGYGDKNAFGIGVRTGKYPCLCPANLNDFVHVDDIVLAHLLLEHQLRNGPSDPAAGQAFNISGGEPLKEGVFSYLVQQCAEKQGIPISMIFVPSRFLFALSIFLTVFDYFYPGNMTNLFGRDLGTLTFSTMLTGSHVLVVQSMEKARKLIGYEPHQTVASALERTMSEYHARKIIME